MGRISRTMIRRLRAPTARAASTNSRFDQASVLARVIRPSCGMATNPRARIMLRTSGPRKTVKARARISAGTESITSNAAATTASTRWR